jgi:hypothetical protein
MVMVMITTIVCFGLDLRAEVLGPVRRHPLRIRLRSLGPGQLQECDGARGSVHDPGRRIAVDNDQLRGATRHDASRECFHVGQRDDKDYPDGVAVDVAFHYLLQGGWRRRRGTSWALGRLAYDAWRDGVVSTAQTIPAFVSCRGGGS